MGGRSSRPEISLPPSLLRVHSSASTPPPSHPPPSGLPVPHRQRTASGALPRYRSRTWRLLAVRQERRPARSGRPTQRAPPDAHGRGCGDILGRNLAHPCVRQAGHPARRSARGNGRRYAGPSEIFRSGDWPRAGVRKGRGGRGAQKSGSAAERIAWPGGHARVGRRGGAGAGAEAAQAAASRPGRGAAAWKRPAADYKE